MRVSFSLYNFADEGVPEPLVVDSEYESTSLSDAFGPERLVITIGDDISNATVAIPLNIHHQLMGTLVRMRAEKFKAQGPGLVGFDKPKIIKPH